MDYQAWGFWLSVASFALSVGAMIVAVVIWFARRNGATTDAIDRVEKNSRDRHVEQEARIIKIESDVRRALTLESLNKALLPIYDRLNSNGEMAHGLKAQLEGVDQTLRELTNAIMQRGLK